MDAAQRIDDALAVPVCHLHILILVIAEQPTEKVQESPKDILGEHQDVILLLVILVALFIYYLKQSFHHLVRPVGVQVLLKIGSDVYCSLLGLVHFNRLVYAPQRNLEASSLLLCRVPLVLHVRKWDHVGLKLNVPLLDLGDWGSPSYMGISQLGLEAVVCSLQALPGLHSVVIED